MTESTGGIDQQQNDTGITRPTEQLSRPDGIVLTSPQREAAITITGLLQDQTKGPRIIVLEGLPGMGKSTLLNHLSPMIEENGAMVVDGTRIRYNYQDIDGGHTGNVIVDAVFYEKDDAVKTVQNKLSALSEVEPVILRGMTTDETEGHIAHLTGNGSSDLSVDDITKYSMGIPLLIEQMLTPGMTREAAVGIYKSYLWYNFADRDTHRLDVTAADKYLRIAPPNDATDSLRGRFLGSDKGITEIYEDLSKVMERWKKLKAEGIEEESPLFVDPESYRIYNQMLQAGSKAHTFMTIFAPEISEEDFRRAQEAFSPNYFDRYNPVPDAKGSGTRHNMFIDSNAADRSVFRKSHILLRDGDTVYMDYGSAIRNGDSNEWDKNHDFEQGKLSIKPTGEPGARKSLFLGCYEHGAFLPYLTLPGWMVESFLQQRGIAYVVENGPINRNYRYDPGERRIVFE